MSTIPKYEAFKRLHQSGNPLIVYNIWDAGTAKALEAAGAKAIATGSMSVAQAKGYEDGESVPLEEVLTIAAQINAVTALLVSIDVEGGYGVLPEDVARNVSVLLHTGVVGINFEDQVIGGTALYHIADQCSRIGAIKEAAVALGRPVFINARTDIFLKADPASDHKALMGEAIERARAYADAGADGFFVPALHDMALIETLCLECPLPVNIMKTADMPPNSAYAKRGVARISYGPAPYMQCMAQFSETARKAMQAEPSLKN